MGRVPKIALAVSLAVHAAIVAAAFALPDLLAGREIPGPGENVVVWLSEPSGGTAFGPGRSAVTAAAPRHRRAAAEGLGEAAPVDGDGPGKDADVSRAGGAGAAGGPGRSRGSGGSELLAKIWSRINASKYYPAAARRSGVTGSPKVSFALDEDGSVKWVRLVESSDRNILDDAALETVRRAAPLPYYPKPITVTVKYSLAD